MLVFLVLPGVGLVLIGAADGTAVLRLVLWHLLPRGGFRYPVSYGTHTHVHAHTYFIGLQGGLH